MRAAAPIEDVRASAFAIPTDSPEADSTFEWSSTTLVLAEVHGGGRVGLGYTYCDRSAAVLIASLLSEAVRGCDALAVPLAWSKLVAAVRNVGRSGIAACAISAVDVALWDLKAKLLDVPLVALLGELRSNVALYASGGFTSYSAERLQAQLSSLVEGGFRRVKMKVGAVPADDLERVRLARAAIGSGTELFVDANGAYARKQALAFAEQFAAHGVTWFEEPVSSDDVDGLRLLRDRAPAGMDIAAGEYGYDAFHFLRLLENGAVDVLQADATRCCGITGFLRAAALADAHCIPLSAHCAPALHLHVCCALPRVAHVEYFHDHARIERMLFDGVCEPARGTLGPDLTRAGLGLELRRQDAERYAVA